MNIETLNYITKIAGFAADQLTSGKTLKASKEWLATAMNADTTPYTAEGVDFEVVNARRSLHDAVNARTKAIFKCQCSNAFEWAAKHHDEAVMNKRVEHTIKIALRDHNVTLHAADVIAWANGDIHFNFTKAAHALAHEAKEAAMNDPRTDDEGNDPREWCGHDIEAAHAEALAMNAAPLAAVTSKRDVIPGAKRLPRTTYKKRITKVKVAGEANGVKTYRISLNNGRVYLYTEGHNFAQVKLAGGKRSGFETITSQYTISRLIQAVAEFKA